VERGSLNTEKETVSWARKCGLRCLPVPTLWLLISQWIRKPVWYSKEDMFLP